MSFKKIYQNCKNQVYVQHGNFLRFDMNYIYIYMNDKNEVEQLISNEFPLLEFSEFKGFLFCKNEKHIPVLPNIFMDIFKTNCKNLNNQFINKKHDIVLKLSGFKSCSPKINNELFYGFTYDNFLQLTTKDVEKMYSEFYKAQTLKSVDDWLKYIKEKCPWDINYANKISEESFKKDILPCDVKIEYDIRHADELSLIKKVEELFENDDELVLILNDFNDILEKITKLVEKRKDITAYRDKNKLLIKYGDLKKLNLQWSIENFY